MKDVVKQLFIHLYTNIGEGGSWHVTISEWNRLVEEGFQMVVIGKTLIGLGLWLVLSGYVFIQWLLHASTPYLMLPFVCILICRCVKILVNKWVSFRNLLPVVVASALLWCNIAVWLTAPLSILLIL